MTQNCRLPKGVISKANHDILAKQKE